MPRINLHSARLLLLVLLVTFLSPATGWAMVADHHDLEHATAFAGSGGHAEEDHEHGDAHSWFGHLLGHLPTVFSAPARLAQSAAVEAELPELAVRAPEFDSDPPLRPPLRSPS